MRVLIIGGSFAGVQAALTTRQAYPEAEIIIIEKQKEIGFIPGSILLYLKKKTDDFQNMHWIQPEQLQEQGIDLRCGISCLGLADEHSVHLSDDTQLSFDKLVIATGSGQFSRTLGEHVSEKVRTFKTKAEAEALLKVLPGVQRVAIVGAGQVGLEMAEALAAQGKEVHLFEGNKYPLYRYFDEEIMDELVEAIEARGVHFYLNETVQEILAEETALLTVSGKIKVELILLAVSTRPDNEIWEKNLQLNADGTIWVDDYLQTSQADVFAVGDAIQVKFQMMGFPIYISLVNNALRTARLAVQNFLQPVAEDSGSLRTVGSCLFGYYLGSTGLTESEYFFYEDDLEIIYINQPINLLEKERLRGKILFNKRTQVIVGAQLIAKMNILDKLNLLVLAIETKRTKQELFQMESVFHPEFVVPKLYFK